MSDTANQIPEDIKTAMKAKDTLALNALRALKSALMRLEVLERDRNGEAVN